MMLSTLVFSLPTHLTHPLPPDSYCVYYFLQNLNMPGTIPQLLYFSYMGLVALAFSFVTAAAGDTGTLWFLRSIYGAVRVD